MLKRRLLFIVPAAGIFIAAAIVLSILHKNTASVPALKSSSGTVAQTPSAAGVDKPLNERLQVPHADGLDCSVAAVFGGGTLELLAQKTFPADTCRFEVLKDDKGRGYLLFIGTTTNQGDSSHTLQLFKPGKGWEQLLPTGGNIPYFDSRNYEFEPLPGGMVSVSAAIYKTDGSGDGPEWKKGYMLCWDPETAALKDFVPGTYLDDGGKRYFDTASVSPDGKYAVVPHEWVFDGSSYVLLYNAEENSLVGRYELPAMYFGFTWSPDGKKVCISRLARIWTDLSVLSVEDGVIAEEMGNVPEKFKSQGIKLKYELNENRPDPTYTLLEWSPDSKKLLVFYEWYDQDTKKQSGTFVYNVADKSISRIRQNAPIEADHAIPMRPDGFSW